MVIKKTAFISTQRTLLIFLVNTLLACANVEPWERSIHAKAIMRTDTDSQHNAYEQHAYASKEATEGGYGLGGGGCGCN